MADVSATYQSLSSTESNNAPAGSTAVGTGLDDNLRMLGALLAASRDASGWGGLTLSTVAGTNTITAVVAVQGSVTMAPTAYSTGMKFEFVPANTNTGATTINVNSLGAKNVFFDGRACVGGEIVQNIPCKVIYDGTQFNIISPVYTDRLTDDTTPDLAADYVQTYDASTTSHKKVLLGRIGAGVLGTEQASTSGTSIDFTSIPSWAKKIIVQFVAVSTSGTSNILVQIGDSGGIETTNYFGAVATLAGSVATGNYGGTGFVAEAAGSASAVRHGALTLSLEDASQFTWVATGSVSQSDAAQMHVTSGSKSLSAALDRVRITTVNGTDTFDAGAVNILYQ
jgi:hypothetical protein